MKAAQLIAHGKPGQFAVRDVPDPKPGPDDVVVQVKACGLNRLDLWLEEDGLPMKVQLPRTPGGEASGLLMKMGLV
jgi:NADPH2:quinone reductase